MERPKFNSEKYSTVQFPRHFDVDQNNYINYLESQLKEKEKECKLYRDGYNKSMNIHHNLKN